MLMGDQRGRGKASRVVQFKGRHIPFVCNIFCTHGIVHIRSRIPERVRRLKYILVQ